MAVCEAVHERDGAQLAGGVAIMTHVPEAYESIYASACERAQKARANRAMCVAGRPVMKHD